jgi:hypothetical protein
MIGGDITLAAKNRHLLAGVMAPKGRLHALRPWMDSCHASNPHPSLAGAGETQTANCFAAILYTTYIYKWRLQQTRDLKSLPLAIAQNSDDFFIGSAHERRKKRPELDRGKTVC